MAATVNKRWTAVLGPMKEEKIWITSDGTNDDTSVSSLIANIETAEIRSVNTDLSGTADPASVTFSGKVLTLRDPAAHDYLISLVGY